MDMFIFKNNFIIYKVYIYIYNKYERWNIIYFYYFIDHIILWYNVTVWYTFDIMRLNFIFKGENISSVKLINHMFLSIEAYLNFYDLFKF